MSFTAALDMAKWVAHEENKAVQVSINQTTVILDHQILI